MSLFHSLGVVRELESSYLGMIIMSLCIRMGLHAMVMSLLLAMEMMLRLLTGSRGARNWNEGQRLRVGGWVAWEGLWGRLVRSYKKGGISEEHRLLRHLLQTNRVAQVTKQSRNRKIFRGV